MYKMGLNPRLVCIGTGNIAKSIDAVIVWLGNPSDDNPAIEVKLQAKIVLTIHKKLTRFNQWPPFSDPIFIKGLDLKIISTAFVHRLKIIVIRPKHLNRCI